MSKMKWIIFAVVVLVIFGGLIIFNLNRESNNFKGDAASIITDGPIADHTLGSDEQKVVLIEYGDFQCPGCRSVASPVKGFVQQHQDRLTFIFRNFPLTNIHPNALAAATAAEAAGLQGKFWEMHDLLFATQESWGDAPVDQRQEVFTSYAEQLGLDTAKFEQDLASQDISDKINRDRQTGRNFGVNSTPTFVLNGEVIKGQDATNTTALLERVERALQEAYPDADKNVDSHEQ